MSHIQTTTNKGTHPSVHSPRHLLIPSNYPSIHSIMHPLTHPSKQSSIHASTHPSTHMLPYSMRHSRCQIAKGQNHRRHPKESTETQFSHKGRPIITRYALSPTVV